MERRKAAAVAVLLLVGSTATATAAELAWTAPPDLAPGIAALPRITGPRTAATAAINRALDGAEREAREAMQACGGVAVEADRPPSRWRRVVEVASTGPALFAELVTDDHSCGTDRRWDRSALVWDLRTGRRVVWPRLLPGLDSSLAAGVWGGTSEAGLLASPVLQDRYLRGYRAAEPRDFDEDFAAACEMVASRADAAFALWPDPARGGLSVQLAGLDWADQSCALIVTIPAAELRMGGADPVLFTP